MVDVPNRLPKIQKRSEKMSKSNVRFVYQQRRESWRRNNKERIENLDKNAAKRNFAKSRTAKRQKGVRTVNSMIKNGAPCNTTPPCMFGRPLSRAIQRIEDDIALTKEEVMLRDADAVLWHDMEYSHIWPHPQVWVACCVCHKYMPTTEIPHIYGSGHSLLKWQVVHEGCLPQYYTTFLKVAMPVPMDLENESNLSDPQSSSSNDSDSEVGGLTEYSDDISDGTSDTSDDTSDDSFDESDSEDDAAAEGDAEEEVDAAEWGMDESDE